MPRKAKTAALPAQFAALEPFVARWALPREKDRWKARVTSSMAEIQAFYDAMLARFDAVVAYLDRHPLDAIPEADRPLFYLTLAFMDISPAVEIFGTPDLPDNAFEIERMNIVERPYGWERSAA
jgi:hypothetical protein